MDFIIDSHMDEVKNAWMISVSGEIDIFNSVQFKTKLLELIESHNINLCINCRDLEYIDSTALGALVAVLKNVKSYGGEIRLKHLKPNLDKLFKITNLNKVFVIEGEDNE